MAKRGRYGPALVAAACWLLASSSLFAAAATAADPPTLRLSLTEAVVLAIRQNRDVANAYRNRVVQKFALAVAEDTFTPKGSLSADVGTSHSAGADTQSANVTPALSWDVPTGAQLTMSWAEDVSRASSGDASSSTRALTLTQPLLKGAGSAVARAPVRIARNTEKIHIEQLRSTLASTIQSVVLAYRGLMQAQAELGIRRRSLARARKLLEINRELIAAGRMARQEQVQAEADVASREVDLASAENNVDRARLTLLGLLALDKYTRIEPDEPLQIPTVKLNYDRLSALALRERPDYQEARLALANLKIDRMLAENGRLPQLDVNGGYSDTRARGGIAGDSSSWDVALSLKVPLFDKSQDLPPLQARVAEQNAANSLVELRQRIEREVLNAVRDVGIRRRQVDLAKRSLTLSEQKLAIEREKLKAGRSSNFQVVQFQNDLVSAQNNELSAVIGYLNALSSLDQTLGTTLQTWRISVEPPR